MKISHRPQLTPSFVFSILPLLWLLACSDGGGESANDGDGETDGPSDTTGSGGDGDTSTSGSGGRSSDSTGGSGGSGSGGDSGQDGGTGGSSTYTCDSGILCSPGVDDLSCCDRKGVNGGTFPMGRSASGSDACPTDQTCHESEMPEHDATVSGYSLDTFEVTVGRFRRFVDSYNSLSLQEGDGSHPEIEGSGWQSSFDALLPEDAAALRESLACSDDATWSDTSGNQDDWPVNCVSWPVAFAFCIWDGGRLPTEAEWEYAAAGGTENRLYPWGDAAPTDQHASFSSGAALGRVGRFADGKSGFGHHDMGGNVWEWALDWLDTGWYSGSGATCNDCARVSSGTHRVIRGGAYGFGAVTLRAATRSGEEPTVTEDFVGFRCAY